MDPYDSDYRKFTQWMGNINAQTNKNRTSRLWVDILHFLGAYVGYYFSVLSGNWLLHNSCLRVLVPLMFVYNHDKYEELCCTAIMDTLTLPDNLIRRFLRGKWTVSAKGQPFHNLASDEVHESIINLQLKTITSRPSHFRTVKLSNFMSYLDKIVQGFESLVYKYKRTEPVYQRKWFICQRTTRMINLVKDIRRNDLKNLLLLPTSLQAVYNLTE